MSQPQIPDGLTVKLAYHRWARWTDIDGGVVTEMSPMRDLGPATGAKVEILPCGGVTVASLYNGGPDPVVVSVARCSPRENFSRAIGRAIATGRALKAYAEPLPSNWHAHPERTEIPR